MKGFWKKPLQAGTVIGVVLLLAACGISPGNDQAAQQGNLQVVVTTTFIGDVVDNIAGDKVDIIELLTPGQNPHSYQPSPMDMVAVSEADLILVNGFGLEEFLDELLEGTDTSAEVIAVSEGIDALVGEHHHDDEDHDEHDGEDHDDHDGEDHDDHDGEDHDDHDGEDHDDHDGEDHMEGAMGLDPHVWFDPNNVQVWAENIANALAEADPVHNEYYQENLQKYQEQLMELDGWIRDQVDLIPADQRELVTDHSSLGYFADEYGLVQIGAVIPALTTEAETSGMELAELIDTIREHQAGAIFIGVDFDPNLAQRVADETDVELVPLYFGSLSDGEPAGTYLAFMRFNVSSIVEALR